MTGIVVLLADVHAMQHDSKVYLCRVERTHSVVKLHCGELMRGGGSLSVDAATWCCHVCTFCDASSNKAAAGHHAWATCGMRFASSTTH